MTGESVEVTLHPLGSAQRRIWLQEQRTPQRPQFAVPVVCHIDGQLELVALRAALAAVLARHEALRTAIRTVDGELQQVVFDPAAVEVPLGVEDLTGHAEAARADLVRRRMVRHAEWRFDLAVVPPLRADLIKLDERRQVLLLTVHHAMCDGASVAIVLRGLFDDYERSLTGRPPDHEPAEIDFGDWAAWHETRLSESMRGTQREFWKAKLADAPTLDFPALGRPAEEDGSGTAAGVAGEVHRFTLDEALVRKLRATCAEVGVSMFCTLLTGMALVLQRYSARPEVCFGTPLSGRDRPELDEVVGMLLNTVVLRLDAGGDPTVREQLHRGRGVIAEAMTHGDVPFEQVVADLDASASDDPLFQVLFTFEEGTQRRWRLPGAAVEVEMSPYRPPRNPLAIALEADADEIVCDLEYRTDVFTPEHIARLGEHYRNALAAIAAAPDAPISTVDQLSRRERHLLLTEWNDTSREFPSGATAAELFGEQVAARPHAVAVRAADGNLTYQQLDLAANALAHRLRAAGAGPEVVVGVLLHRSALLVVALLAVLKSGGAYLALDVRQPRYRHRTMLRDSGSPLLVTTSESADLAQEAGARPVLVDTAEPAGPAASAEPPGVHPHNLAYVLYTSGSTGRPNGVAVSQRALVRLVKNPGYCEVGPEHVHLQLSSTTFDASVFEVWGALVNGGSVVIPGADRTFLEQIREGLIEHSVTTVVLISPQLPLVLEDGDLLGRARQLLVGGDVLSPQRAAEVRQRHPHLLIAHMYGPTESTLFATSLRLRRVDATRASVPIGSPITNTRAYVLDPQLRPQPIDVPGELYLAGEGLARGYLHDAALTAARFVADPFGPRGERMYRTGDLARWNARGELEFLGRADDQVKIRGYRVEPGEVRAALASHPEVRDAAVLVVQRPRGAELAGYAVLATGSDTGAAQLRRHLADRMPSHLVPETITLLDVLPLTPNGKLDRRALPTEVRPGTHTPVSAGACSATEQAVAELWREALDLPGVDRDADFFGTGGNSLRLLQLYQAVERRWPGVLRVGELFDLNTIARQAASIDERTGAQPRTQPAGELPTYEL